MSFNNKPWDNTPPWDGAPKWGGILDGWDQKSGVYIPFDLKARFSVTDRTFSNDQPLTSKQGVQSGSLTVVDTSTGTVKVVSGELEITGSGAANQTGVLSDGITKALGKAMFVTHTHNSAIDTAYAGLRSAQSLALQHLGVRATTTTYTITPDSEAAQDPTVASIVNATDYKLLFLMGGYDASAIPFIAGDTVADFTRGIHYFIKGGTFTSWTRLWTGISDSSTPLYGMLSASAASAILFDNILIPTNVLDVDTMFQPNTLATFTGTDNDQIVSAYTPEVALGVTGTGNPWASGGTSWTIQTNAASNDPTLGADLLATKNGSFTDWTGVAPNDQPDVWTTTEEGDATSTVTENPAGQCQLIANGAIAQIAQAILTVGKTYQYTIDIKDVTSGSISIGSSVNLVVENTPGVRTGFFKADSTSFLVKRTGGLTNITFDDILVKQVTQKEIFATIETGLTEGIFDVNVTIPTTSDGFAGIVNCLDSVATPANWIETFYNRGTGKVEVAKFVAGTRTSLVNVTATYAAGAQVRTIISDHVAGTSLKLKAYYNGALIGTEQTIEDAGIVDNTLHGIMDTGAGVNSIETFHVQPRTNSAWDALISAATGGTY